MWNLHVVLKVTRSKLSFSSNEHNHCLFVECQSLESCWVICFFHFNSEKVSLCNIWIQDSGFTKFIVLCTVETQWLHHPMKFLLCTTPCTQWSYKKKVNYKKNKQNNEVERKDVYCPCLFWS